MSLVSPTHPPAGAKLLATGLLCVLALAARPTPLVAAPAEANVTFSGPTQDFSLDLAASGTVSASGNGTYHLLDAWYGTSHKSIELPYQTRPLQMNTTLTSDPAGSATIGFDNQTLANPTLANLNVDFRNGAGWDFQFAPMVFDMDIEDVGNVGLRLEIFGSVTSLSFVADPGAVPADPFYFIPGKLTASLSGYVTGVAQDVIGGTDIDLGVLTTFDETSTSDLDWPGLMTLTPGAPPYPSDLTVDLALELPLSMPFSLDTSGHDEQVQGHGTGNLDFYLDYWFDGELTLSNPSYALHATAPGAVVPEPSSLVLAGAGVLGLLTWQRKRIAARLISVH